MVRTVFLLLFTIFCFAQLQAQESNLRIKTFISPKDTIVLDSLTIFPNSLHIYCGTSCLSLNDYTLDHQKARVYFFNRCSDTLRIQYRVLPLNLGKVYVKRDTSILFNEQVHDREKFLQSSNYSINDVFGGSSLQKSGSISRGITFGNNQDLGINSSLNLELAGDIAPNLKLLASVSDDNIPIQADGNTNKLQEFDQVFIQLYNDRLKLIAGDYWLYKPDGYFMNYRKRGQGLTMNYKWQLDSNKVVQTQVSGALSKGKFARQIIQGIEGNQGPYRLLGNENEPYIIVLSGTERVYIDGKLLERGQEFDYIINYNTSELVFTARNLITKDSRIVVEFQYADQNYARSMMQSANLYQGKNVKVWVNAFSEQDAKNQTLQQPLNQQQRQILTQSGDSLHLAYVNSIDSVGFFENQILYKMVDSLSFDSILVYSVRPDSALYRATFTYVGLGKGDYILDSYNALGKVYKWIAPINGSRQGDYIPSRILMSPKQKQMVSAGVQYKINKRTSIETELSYTKNDLNTFSNRDVSDDQGYANRTKFTSVLPLKKDSINPWELISKVEVEALDRNFSPIEQYRSVEFDRDWNTRNRKYRGNQLASTLGLNFKNGNNGNFNFEGQQFRIGTDYLGLRTNIDGKWHKKGFFSQWDGAFLSSESQQKSEFVKHRVEVSQQLGKVKFGFKDDHELNRFEGIGYQLDKRSYQFYDYQFYFAGADDLKNNFRLFYRERLDQLSDSTELSATAKATTMGSEIRLTKSQFQTLNFVSSYRSLKIVNKQLINQTPENNLLGRVDYELRLWNGALTWNNFYEVGSGLELKREFLYIQVNDGQGIYTWVDYNSDGIKDLNEFEIAQFVDQASYIRVFTPSNTYVKTFSNEFNQSINWRPERIWSQQKGLRKLASRFSDQARVRINRKTNLFDGIEAFNPFALSIVDSNLISSNSNIRNSVFFNKTSSLFNAEYIYQSINSKTLLASGFDSRLQNYHECAFRWNIKRVFTIETKAQRGSKQSFADYTIGRNYNMDYFFIQPALIYQPGTTFRVSLEGSYAEKQNEFSLGGEKAYISRVGALIKYNQLEKGSLQAEVKLYNIHYIGLQNTALAFEMLESLKPGINATWNVGYQRSVSKNLQISVQYNGRKSENSKMIHSGGMEVRAFF